MKKNDSIKKKLNKVGLILLLFFGGVIIYVIHDEHRRKEAVREFQQRQKEMNSPYNTFGEHNNYQPSFGSGEPQKTSNRETCRSHHCLCHTRRSWLEYKGYNYCPSCNHATSYHHD